MYPTILNADTCQPGNKVSFGTYNEKELIWKVLRKDGNRRLLLADEPTGNLDSENSDNIIDLLLKLAHDENRCVIVVTHDLSVMDRADVVYRINDGLLERR